VGETPLFPLQTVLFPGGPLQLRVFEPRYVDMIGRCLKGVNRFGVLCIEQGSEVGPAETFKIGTLAQIVDWRQEEGGLLGITVIGRERFELIERDRRPDGLYVGRVTLLDPEPEEAVAPEHAALVTLLQRLLAQLPIYRSIEPRYGDAVWVSHRLAELLPLPLPVKQSMLEQPGGQRRLEQLRGALPQRA
jgi:Lon protease-like protein